MKELKGHKEFMIERRKSSGLPRKVVWVSVVVSFNGKCCRDVVEVGFERCWVKAEGCFCV